MTYDNEVRANLAQWTRRKSDVSYLIDAIPPLTLKTEDGRFVKVERYGAHHTQACMDQLDLYGDSCFVGEEGCICAPGIRVYRIVEDPTQ